MYNYIFGYLTHENNDRFVLSHEEKFTKDELISIVAEGLLELKGNLRDKHLEMFFNKDKDIDKKEREKLVKSLNIENPAIEDFYYNGLLDWLVEEKGFYYKTKTVEKELLLPGWGHPFDSPYGDEEPFFCKKEWNKLKDKLEEKEK